jgi:hypothetical protein
MRASAKLSGTMNFSLGMKEKPIIAAEIVITTPSDGKIHLRDMGFILCKFFTTIKS